MTPYVTAGSEPFAFLANVKSEHFFSPAPKTRYVWAEARPAAHRPINTTVAQRPNAIGAPICRRGCRFSVAPLKAQCQISREPSILIVCGHKGVYAPVQASPRTYPNRGH